MSRTSFLYSEVTEKQRNLPKVTECVGCRNGNKMQVSASGWHRAHKENQGFVLFKGRLQGTALSSVLTVITTWMQRMKVLSLTGKPCNIKVYRTLHIRILTVKPNSCGQEKKKKNCVNTKSRFRCLQNLSRVCSTLSEIFWFSLPFKNDSIFVIVNLKVRSTSYTCFILCCNLDSIKWIFLENVCSSHADSKNPDLQQKKNLFAMDTYALNRMYLCAALLKRKSASLHKHWS